MNLNIGRQSRFLLLIMLLVIIVSSTPNLTIGTALLIPFALSLVYVFVNIQSKKVNENYKLVLCATLYIFVSIIYKIGGVSSAGWGDLLKNWYFFFPIILMLYLPKSPNRILINVWWLMNIVIILNIADNIWLSIKYPELNVARHYMDEETLAGLNAGGSRFYTFSMFYFCVCYLGFLNCSHKWTKVLLGILASIAAVYVVGFCNKAAVVVYLLMALVLIYYAKRAKKITTLVPVLFIVGILAFFIVELYSDKIIQLITEYSSSERLSKRLVMLIDSDNAEASDTSFNAREELWWVSLRTWVSSPINFVFGIGDHRATFNAASTGIGQHSELMDALAKYGIIGAILLYTTFTKSFKYILSIFDQKYKLQLIIIFFILIMCGLTKGIFNPEVGCIMFILLPLSAKMIESSNNKIIVKHGSK